MLEREGQKFVDAWEEVIRTREELFFDVEKMKHLIFDTYTYFWNYREYNSMLMEDLPIYKYMIWFCTAWRGDPDSCERCEYAVCADFTKGLCHAIENRFKRGYYKISLPLGLAYPIPAGYFRPEADMSSYESYEKIFRKELKYFREQEDAMDEG